MRIDVPAFSLTQWGNSAQLSVVRAEHPPVAAPPGRSVDSHFRTVEQPTTGPSRKPARSDLGSRCNPLVGAADEGGIVNDGAALVNGVDLDQQVAPQEDFAATRVHGSVSSLVIRPALLVAVAAVTVLYTTRSTCGSPQTEQRLTSGGTAASPTTRIVSYGYGQPP